MLSKTDVINFFDERASSWDAEMIRNDDIINTILDNAEVTENKTVLDVACGTGVLFPDYLKRNVKSILGVDISKAMIEIAAGKIEGSRIKVICTDMEEADLHEQFDCVVVYNAFPHFSDPQKIISNLARHTKKGGTMTIAHGMGKKMLDNLHHNRAHKVSNGLMEADELAALFEPYFKVTVCISEENMYQIVGRRI